LTDLGRGAGQFVNGEQLKARVEAHKGVRAKITQPDDILIIHIYSISLRLVSRKFPFAPGVAGWIVYGHLT
jgi:hypothetical protein